MSDAGPLMEKMGLEVLEVSADRVVGRLPVQGNTQPYGLFHGGASGALAEALAVIGAGLTASRSDRRQGSRRPKPRAIEIKVNHVKSATSGSVTGTATPLSGAGSTQLWEIRMRNDDGELTAYSTATIDIGAEDHA